jgi:hypothetical protein
MKLRESSCGSAARLCGMSLTSREMALSYFAAAPPDCLNLLPLPFQGFKTMTRIH